MELAVMALLARLAPDHAGQRAWAADLPALIHELVPPGPPPPPEVLAELQSVIGTMLADRLGAHQALGIL